MDSSRQHRLILIELMQRLTGSELVELPILRAQALNPLLDGLESHRCNPLMPQKRVVKKALNLRQLKRLDRLGVRNLTPLTQNGSGFVHLI